MAVALVDRVAIASDPVFGKQVRMALLSVAITVADEPTGTTPNSAYVKRQALAQQVLAAVATPAFVDRFAWAVASLLTTQPTDAAILQILTDNFSKLAGVTALDVT